MSSFARTAKQLEIMDIVLKRTDHGEADRMLTLFTPDLGKMRAILR